MSTITKWNTRVSQAFLLSLLLVGCSAKEATSKVALPPPAPADPWIISNLAANSGTPALLWNGLIGIRVSPDLMSIPKGGMFDISKYQKDGEEKILTLPNPISLTIDHETNEFRPQDAKDFQSQLDMRSGVLRASWTEEGFKVVGEMVIHPNRRFFAQKWTITPPRDASVTVGFGNIGVGETIRTIEKESGASLDMTDQLKGAEGDLCRARTVIEGTSAETPDKVSANKTVTTQITWSFEKGSIPTYNEIASEALAHLKSQWETDVEIDGPVEDQQFVRSALFYLRGAIHPKGGMSISPMGLSSDIYFGHVFWDADIWVFPALALIDPEKAKAIPAYRLEKLGRASSSYIQWRMQGMPGPNGNAGPVISTLKGEFVRGAKFPWESSISGAETVPGQSRFQDHITGSVAWSVKQAFSLGFVEEDKATKLLSLAQTFYLSRSKQQDGSREIHNTMSPDENHIGDNDLYTNLLAMWCENQGKWPAKPTYKLPKDDKTFLTYDNDALRGYKQAAAVLSIYPLQYPPAEAQAKQMMERFADKVSKNGPAMTDSIHAIVWARLGEKDKAYAAWHDSWKPFVKPPFLLFSEKRNSSRTYFTTGAAGSLQGVVYGFAGIRIDDKKAPNAQWSIPLKNGKTLSIAPNLPKEWKRLTLKNLTILGKKYTFEIVGDKVTVK
jgi:trehalose/maltose hydrolase-like predicted phosphorylase